MPSFSKRGDIAAFLAMDVMAKAKEKSREGEAICHMEVGQPGTPAPDKVRRRAKQALDEEIIGYTEALGLPSLRARIAVHYKDEYGVTIKPEQVVITTGSSAGFVLAFLATLDAGDKVAVPRPGYPCYREILKSLDVQPHFLPLGFDNNWQPEISQIEEAIKKNKIKALLLASPSNPTGVVMEDALVRDIANLANANYVWFIMEDFFHGLVYDQEVMTLAGFNEATIVLNSFSKYYSMTGWRIGWMVVPPNLVRTIEKLSQNLFISPPCLSQNAAIAAFEAKDELEEIKAGYRANREILQNGLLEVGIKRMAPAEGAFYIYADMSDFTDDSLAFSQNLLQTHGIAACPGLDFDEVNGRYMMRFSYAGSEAEIVEAVKRLKEKPLS